MPLHDTCNASAPRRAHPAVLPLVLALALACGDGTTSPSGPGSGAYTVTVNVTTSGVDADPDGYTLSLGSVEREVGATGAATFTGVPAGTHELVLAGVAPNCQVDGGPTRSVAVSGAEELALSITCQSVVATGLYTELACPGLTVTPIANHPLSVVNIGALPASLEEPRYLRASWDGGGEYALVHVEPATGGTGTTGVPIHPSGSLDGGEVTLRVAGGLQSCPPITLTVGSLPAAPGELEAVVDLLQALVAFEAERAGVTVAELKQVEAASVPDRLLPLAIAQNVVDRPDNPNSLAAVLAGTAPLTAGVAPADLDRIIGATGLRQALGGILAEAAPLARAPAGADALDCILLEVDVPSLLDQCMTIAADAAARSTGLDSKGLEAIGMLTDLAGSVPEPRVKIVAAIVAAGVWLVQAADQGTASLLPSSFVDIEVEAAPSLFYEDQEGSGDWTAAVRATSTGWALDQMALDGLNKLMGFTGAHAAFVERYLGPALEPVIELLKGMIEAAFINGLIANTGNSGIVSVAPRLFGPVDIPDAEWSVRELDPEGPIAFVSHTNYEPRETGHTRLRVATVEGKFGGQHISDEPGLLLRVEPIAIDLIHDGTSTQTIIAKEPNQQFSLEVQVHNSAHPEMVELVDDPGRAGTATLTPGAPATLAYTAPADLGRLPEVVRVRHTATTGLRATSTEPREAILEIRSAALVIVLPGEVCVAPGSSQQYAATVLGVDDKAVDWSASQGSISSSGLFTAPAGVPVGTVVTITATSRADSSATASVTATIGCACGFQLTVGGSVYSGQPGDLVRYTGEGDGVHILDFHNPTTLQSAAFTLVDGGIATAPGVYGGHYTGTFFPPGHETEFANPATLNLAEFVPHTVLRGSVAGQVREFGAPDGSGVGLSLTFQIFPTPEGSDFIFRGCAIPEAGS